MVAEGKHADRLRPRFKYTFTHYKNHQSKILLLYCYYYTMICVLIIKIRQGILHLVSEYIDSKQVMLPRHAVDVSVQPNL